MRSLLATKIAGQGAGGAILYSAADGVPMVAVGAEEVEDCASKEWDTDHVTLSEYLASMETCDNTLIRDSQSYFEDTFHSIAIIVVCSLILVIMILGFGLYFFK